MTETPETSGTHRDQVVRSPLFIICTTIIVLALMMGTGGWLLYKSLNSQAESGKSLAVQVREACDSDRLEPRDRADLCEDAERVIREVPIEDPEIQDPEIQEPEIQEPEIQESESQDSEIQQPESQQPEQQEGEIQDDEIQDPELQEPEVQEPENQDPEVDDPEPNDPQDPAETITLIQGGQTWICTRDGNSPPRNPTYTCELQVGEPQNP